jgi:hypothetical protein
MISEPGAFPKASGFIFLLLPEMYPHKEKHELGI